MFLRNKKISHNIYEIQRKGTLKMKNANKITKMISLDTSTANSGVTVWHNANIYKNFNLKKPKKEAPGDSWMIRQLIDLLDKEHPDIVVVEEEPTARNMKVTRQLIMIIGVVKGWCISNNVFFDIYSPKVWRKLVANENEKIPSRREESKAWAISKVKELFNIDEPDDNKCESLLIGQAYINLIDSQQKKEVL